MARTQHRRRRRDGYVGTILDDAHDGRSARGVGSRGVDLKDYFKKLISEEELAREKVALWLFFCFPLGLYLLWKHPVLGRDKRWWGIGGA